MAASYPVELYPNIESALPEEEYIPEERRVPEALRAITMESLLMRLLCFLALWRPDLQDHWMSLQSDEAFESVRTMMCSILGNTITIAGILIALSGGFFKAIASPVAYFDYTSPAPYILLFMSLMLAMITMLTSGWGMLSWLHTDRHWTQEQLKRGGYVVVFYLLSIVAPTFFVTLSLNSFIWATLIAGFFSQSTISRIVTALLLVMYIAIVGMISVGFVWNYATCLASR